MSTTPATSFLEDLFSTDFMPHGYCFMWQPKVLWMHVISDMVIVTAYYSIPFTLLYMLRNQRNVPHKWLLALFSAFIFLCGTTHLFAAIGIWNPLYYLEGVIKVLTACASIATAALLFPLVPKLARALKQLEYDDAGSMPPEPPQDPHEASHEAGRFSTVL